jgi:hypothetical protein
MTLGPVTGFDDIISEVIGPLLGTFKRTIAITVINKTRFNLFLLNSDGHENFRFGGYAHIPQ